MPVETLWMVEQNAVGLLYSYILELKVRQVPNNKNIEIKLANILIINNLRKIYEYL